MFKPNWDRSKVPQPTGADEAFFKNAKQRVGVLRKWIDGDLHFGKAQPRMKFFADSRGSVPLSGVDVFDQDAEQ
jgi:hypothetical protein